MNKPFSQHHVVWRRIHDDSSLEYFQAITTNGAPTLHGKIITAVDGSPLLVDYDIQCASDLQSVQQLQVLREWRGERKTLTLDADGPLRWRIEGAHAPALDGCTDIDIEWTPSTNVFPIRRLSEAAGAEILVKAAWVRLPLLTVERSDQRYTRLGPHLYRYENVASGFSAELEVDEVSLPITYGRIWSRLAEWRSPA